MPQQQQQRERWHLSKEVGLTFILAITVQSIGLIWWGRGVIASVEQRIALLEAARGEQIDRDRSQDRRAEEKDAALSGRLDRIDDKLDRLIERLAPRVRP